MREARSMSLIRWPHRFPHSAPVLVCALILAVLAGCAPLPDVSPFVSATVDLRAAVTSAGEAAKFELKAVDVELAKLKAAAERKPGAESVELAEGFGKEWARREQMMQAMVLYAESLHRIVQAGNTGAQSAEKVVTSVSELAEAVGHPIPMAKPAIELASDAVKLISKNIALARAAKSLEASLTNVQPAVEGLVELMVEDVNDLEALFVTANRLVQHAYRGQEQFDGLLPYRRQLRTYLYSIDPNKHPASELERVSTAVRLFEVSNDLAAERDAGIADIDRRLRLGRQLMSRMRTALKEWAIAHRNIAAAVRSRNTVDVRSILATSIEIRSLVERMQEL